MAFVSGVRQAGKTTFAKQLLKKRGGGAYWNWDETQFRRAWTKDPKSSLPTPASGDVPIPARLGRLDASICLDVFVFGPLYRKTILSLRFIEEAANPEFFFF